MDQVGQKRHGAGKDEDHGLYRRDCTESGEADQHRLDSRTRADDRGVDEAVRVAVLVLGASEHRRSAMGPRVVTPA